MPDRMNQNVHQLSRRSVAGISDDGQVQLSVPILVAAA